jgi:hypothetical protein
MHLARCFERMADAAETATHHSLLLARHMMVLVGVVVPACRCKSRLGKDSGWHQVGATRKQCLFIFVFGRLSTNTSYLENLPVKCLLATLQNGAFDTESGSSVWINEIRINHQSSLKSNCINGFPL